MGMTAKNPFVSFVVLSYNQEEFISEALVSALEQDYNLMEVIVSDDCSTDRSFAVIETCILNYSGSKKVKLHRNETNVGLAENLNRAWGMSKGELIVVQGGDDISLPNRTSELVKLWTSKSPRADLVFSNIYWMNSNGTVTKTETEPCNIPTLEEVIKGKWFIAGGMAAAYSHSLAGECRPLDPRIVYEDYALTFRALAGNGILHTAKPLVKYRQHDASVLANAQWNLGTRSLAQQRSRHESAELLDRFQAWQQSGRKNTLFTFLLKRDINTARLDASSCFASQSMAAIYSIWALISLRPRLAILLFKRDVLRL
jgi:glycosyltransferase involved in cell wall biosynthesis